MVMNPAHNSDYEVTGVQNIEPDHAEFLLGEARDEELVSCKPVPGAETMPPNKLNVAPHMTVRVYELDEQRSEDYILVTCLLRGGDGPGGILIDKAIVFNGEIGDMLDSLLRDFDKADWSNGLKCIDNIRVDSGYEYIESYLQSVSELLEEDADNRYAMDAWEEYMKNNNLSGHPSTLAESS